MKNVIIAAMLVFGMYGFSSAGECAGGTCFAPLRPVRKVVNVTKEIIVAPVRIVANVTAPRTVCESVATSCGSTTREVVKYQPLRRRLVNRSTTVGCDCGCQ